MTTRREATSCGVGSPSGYAGANREQGPRVGDVTVRECCMMPTRSTISRLRDFREASA